MEQNDKVIWRTGNEGWSPIPHCVSPHRVLNKKVNYCSTAVVQLKVANRPVVIEGVGLELLAPQTIKLLLALAISKHWFDWRRGVG